MKPWLRTPSAAAGGERMTGHLRGDEGHLWEQIEKRGLVLTGDPSPGTRRAAAGAAESAEGWGGGPAAAVETAGTPKGGLELIASDR